MGTALGGGLPGTRCDQEKWYFWVLCQGKEAKSQNKEEEDPELPAEGWGYRILGDLLARSVARRIEVCGLSGWGSHEHNVLVPVCLAHDTGGMPS